MFFNRRAGNKFVDRGDPDGSDFVTGNFIMDNTWRTLSISEFIPYNTKLVLLRLSVVPSAVNKVCYFRKDGNTNEYNVDGLKGQVINVGIVKNVWVSPTANKLIEYKIEPASFSTVNLTVRGWFV